MRMFYYMQSYIGYHGTTIECAKKIEKEKHYNPCTKDTAWLGNGVYFFIDDKHQAYMFTKFKNKAHSLEHEEICVLKTIVISPDDNYMNLLVDKYRKDVYEVAEFLKSEIKEKLGNKWEHPEGFVLNFMYAHKAFDFVIAAYDIPKRKKKLGFSEIHIQMCVKNDMCIQKASIRSVNCDGYARI